MENMPRSREVIADRFTIEQLAGFGGMGQVYRARDRVSGGLVAVKVMHDAERLEIGRFAREAQVLATLFHPGIVRYIDSGTTAEGEPYLVMEWLSGETLSARLQRTQLTLAEALTLGRRVASALGATHRRGVVHRDIKPSNLFLRDSTIDKVALIDFGMARRPVADPKLTMTGTMLGTPGYIAPEQVYNVPNLDGRADIFSLGCVLYRCLSGRAPFRGPDALRLLLNGTPDEMPRLRELRPSIPNELDDLVARMLSRAPDDRPPNGDVVGAELLAIEEREPRALSARSGPRSVLSEIMATERRLVSLVLARLAGSAERPLPVAERRARERALYEVVERHRGKLEVLADGFLLVILSHADAATDLAARAARCALALRNLLGNGSVVVVSGREVLGPGLSESELLDRAVDLFETTAKRVMVRIDELTSALLRDRFDTGRSGRHLRGELREPGRVRLLAGEPSACVGREQELDQLETIYDRCVEDHVASMVLVTGAEGVGKSRLGDELLRRLEARGQAVEIWLGKADALNAGSAFGLLAQVVRRASGLLDSGSGGSGGSGEPGEAGEAIEARRDKLRAWVARHPEGGGDGGDGGTRFAELLGELVGTPFEVDANGELGAAPQDPMAASEQLGQAFLRFLRAECAMHPVVIVLEDLHWGDLPTIKLIDAALGALSDQPLLVLALARTQVHEMFPQLWADRRVQEIRLRKLSRRASAQLVRQVLGDTVGEETLDGLVERSDRHAAYLEQLIRAVADGNATATPHTVLAMVQARIENLDPAARRVLRAASIFGEIFWRGGVEALLGGGDTAAWLAELVEQGMVVVADEGRFPTDIEYHFRHALVREAAYEMLTKDDRVAGHWLAGQWLEQVGETDAMSVEEHFERCGSGGLPGSRP
jgi:eukaryotic-like serine/threonine-protein kinase